MCQSFVTPFHSNSPQSDVCGALEIEQSVFDTRTDHCVVTDVLSTKRKMSRASSDDHNETCEVCEAGGDLLCCDTCSLVFHLKCIRPKLSAVPRGDWSCPRCIIEVYLRPP